MNEPGTMKALRRNRRTTGLAAALSLMAAACGGGDRAVERAARAEIADRLSAEDADSTIAALYRQNDGKMVWVSAGGLTKRGRRAADAIATAGRDGFDPEAYGVEDALAAIETARNGELGAGERARALADAELALAAGIADLLRDLETGASRPATVQPAWRVAQRDSLTDRLLPEVFGGADPEEALQQVRPASGQYGRLAEALDRLRELETAGGWPEVPDRRLRAGDDNPAVAALRARLSLSLVDQERADATEGADRPTLFDEGLDHALRSFQERHRLEVDGEVDVETVMALNVPVEERLRSTELNLERWRWMPRELGQRVILVNVAGYDIRLLEEDRTVLHMKAVVGKPAWRTPLFSDTMTHMIVHPYWNVPESILTEELLPSARADEHYLVANNYEVVDSEGRPLEGEFDLDDLDPATEAGLRVRQKPGAGNALGRVKFMFPNNENVYLHDTPATALFERTARALSHGCVRVERPLELARFLADWTGGDPKRFETALETEENARIDLPRAVPVYLAYFTVWVDEGGRPHFLADPYDLDREMSDLLLTTPATRLAASSAGTRTSGGG